eukprot:g10782.t2
MWRLFLVLASATARPVTLPLQGCTEHGLTESPVFYGEVKVGEERRTFRVLFDTGSSNLWLPSAQCSSAPCDIHQRFVPSRPLPEGEVPGLAMSFATGQMVGFAVNDSMCLGSLCTELTIMAAAQDTKTIHWLANIKFTPSAKRPGSVKQNEWKKATTVAKSKEEFLSHVNAIAGADVGGLAKGVDKVLLRQRAAELQQICNEISAVRESQGKTTRSVHESRWMELASYAFVVALTLPYYVCLTYRSWFVDEGFAIYRNPDAKGETPLLQVLRNDFWGTSLNPPEGYITHKSWRPLITLMYAGEWLLCARYGFEGLEMQPMRFVSCVRHSLNSALLLWAMRLASLPLSCACLGASLFAAHPIHVDARLKRP